MEMALLRLRISLNEMSALIVVDQHIWERVQEISVNRETLKRLHVFIVNPVCDLSIYDTAFHCAFEMPFTPAEKQRRYRERRKNNPEKEAEAKRKDRERYHANKRLIRDLTIREHRAIKKKWRSANARRKDKMEGHYAEEGASDEEQSDDDNESSLRLHHEVIVKDEPPDPPYLASPSSRRRGPPARRPRQLRCHNTATEASPALDRNLVRTIRSVTRAELRRGSGRGRDECDVFGEYIANALRKHDERTRAMIKHAIGNILFEQEMKQYVVATAPPRAAAPDRNPLLLDADHERAPARPDYGL